MKGLLLPCVIILTLGLTCARSVSREIVELLKSIKDKYDIEQSNDEEFFNILGIKYKYYKDKLMLNDHDKFGYDENEYEEIERNIASMENRNFKDHDGVVIFWGEKGFEQKYIEESDNQENSKDTHEVENLWKEEEENDEIEREIEAEYEDKVEHEADKDDDWDTRKYEEKIEKVDQENEEHEHEMEGISGKRERDLNDDERIIEEEEEEFFEKYNNVQNLWEDEHNVDVEDGNAFKHNIDVGWEDEKRKIEEGDWEGSRMEKMGEVEARIEEEEEEFFNNYKEHDFEKDENNVKEDGDFFEEDKDNDLEEKGRKFDESVQKFFENDEYANLEKIEGILEEEEREYFENDKGEVEESEQDNKQDGEELGNIDTVYFKEFETNIKEDHNIYSEEKDGEDNEDETSFFEWEENYDTNKEDEDFGVVDYLEEIKLKDEGDKSDRQLYEDFAEDDHAEMDYEPDNEIGDIQYAD